MRYDHGTHFTTAIVSNGHGPLDTKRCASLIACLLGLAFLETNVNTTWRKINNSGILRSHMTSSWPRQDVEEDTDSHAVFDLFIEPKSRATTLVLSSDNS